jgi:uncharacterized delta-60 repeat protein
VLAAACGLVLACASAQVADARLGDLDPGFDGDGVALPDVGAGVESGAQFEAVVSRPDGGAVAGGSVFTGAASEGVVVQLTPGGALDPGFGTGGVRRIVDLDALTQIHDVALDGAGQVLAAAEYQLATTAPISPALIRLSANGATAQLFPIGGTGEAHAVAPQGGGTLVAGWRDLGSTGQDVFMLARLTAAGELDPAFGGGDGIVETGFPGFTVSQAAAMAIAPSGEIVLAGFTFANASVPAIARFDPTGTSVQTFLPAITNPSGQTAGTLNDVRVDGAGRITAAGVSGGYAMTLRLLANGALDPAFGAGGVRFGAIDESANLQGLALDGERALVAGSAGPGRGPQHLLLGAQDGAGTPDGALGGAPPGWRTFALGTQSGAFDLALGPNGTVYTAGVLGTPDRPYVSRHLGNAAPTAVLNAAATATTGAPVTFDAAGSSDPEGEPLRYAFDLDGDGSYEFDGGTNPLALRSFPAPGSYTVGVRVTDPRGASATAASSVAVSAAAQPAPRPLLSQQGVARPVRGIIRIRLPGTKKFVTITELTAIPNGTEIDARRGRVLLTVLHDASGRLDGARFYAGRFIFNQGRGAVPVTTLRLSGGSFAACGRKAKARRSLFAVASASAQKGGKKKPVRKLWGDGRGKFRTRGRWGAATVRGTKWLTQDRCDGTRIKVVRGKVDADDLVRPRRKNKRLNAGDAILIRKRG